MEKQQIGDENDIVMSKIRSVEDFEEGLCWSFVCAGCNLQEAVSNMGITLKDYWRRK